MAINSRYFPKWLAYFATGHEFSIYLTSESHKFGAMQESQTPLVTKLLLLGIGLASAALIAVQFLWNPPALTLEGNALPGGDFSLQSADGPVALSDFRGQLVALYFGYTQCPDICPTALAYLTQGIEQLPEPAQAAIQVLFVSVDPERDSLAHLKTYAGFFNPRFIGLTGSPEQIQRVAGQYGAAYRKVASDSKLGYSIDHTAALYLIDPAGKLQTQIAHGTTPQEIAAILQQWLPANLKP